MTIDKESIEALFSVGDVFPRISRDEHKLRVNAIRDDGILLQSVSADAGEISLEYDALSHALEAGDPGTAAKSPVPMQFFAAEYRRRAQIRRDEEVDALWDSAGELFLYSPCSPC